MTEGDAVYEALHAAKVKLWRDLWDRTVAAETRAVRAEQRADRAERALAKLRAEIKTRRWHDPSP